MHDLDNALLPLRCRIEVLEQRGASDADLEQVRAIGSGLDHLGRLGRALRDRIANGGEQVGGHEAICLHRWWLRHRTLLHSMLPEGALLQALLSPSLPQVRISEVDLSQIVTNLLSNAAKAMAESPAVVISAAPLSGGHRVRVSVADNGCGMSPEALATAGIAPSGVPQRGSGNGLAIVRRVLAAHGGTFEIESLPGQGTRASLLLLTAVRDAAEDGPLVMLSIHDRALRLLIRELLQARGAVICDLGEGLDEVDGSAACWVVETASSAPSLPEGASPIDRFLSGDPDRRALLIGGGAERSDPRIHRVESGSDLASVRTALEAMLLAHAGAATD